LFRRILVAVDGSESSKRAANVAIDIAEKYKAELHVIHTISPPTSRVAYSFPSITLPAPSQAVIDAYYLEAKKLGTAIVHDMVARAEKQGVKAKPEVTEAVSSVVETIVDHATNDKVDLVVIGSRGLGGFKKLLLGSVSSGVVTHASCPVLVVR